MREIQTESTQRNGDSKNRSEQRYPLPNSVLSPAQTLHCFGDYYRKDMLEHPEATDHQNIRNFMNTGWKGVEFMGEALKKKLTGKR